MVCFALFALLQVATREGEPGLGWGWGAQRRPTSCRGRGSPEACPGARAGAGAALCRSHGRTPPHPAPPRAKENSRLLGGAGRGAGQAATGGPSHPRPRRPPQTPPSPRPAGSELAFCLFVGELEGVCESNPVRSKLRLRVGIRVLQNAHTASTLPRKCSN